MKPLSVSVIALTLSVPVVTQPFVTARGIFTSRDIEVAVASAIAFTATSRTIDREPVILVAISNVMMEAENLADFVDRKRAVELLVRDSVTPVVYFEFTTQGTFQGATYQFGAGHGCDFCSGDARSTVKLVDGKLVGTVVGSEGDREFKVTLNVPVMSDDHGAALPEDGGAPAKAYRDYDLALTTQDATALEETLSSSALASLENARLKGELALYVERLAEDHPVRSFTITRGWATAEKASLLVEGESGSGRVAGEVLLVLEDGAWRVDRELVQRVK